MFGRMKKNKGYNGYRWKSGYRPETHCGWPVKGRAGETQDRPTGRNFDALNHPLTMLSSILPHALLSSLQALRRSVQMAAGRYFYKGGYYELHR